MAWLNAILDAKFDHNKLIMKGGKIVASAEFKLTDEQLEESMQDYLLGDYLGACSNDRIVTDFIDFCQEAYGDLGKLTFNVSQTQRNVP